MLKESDMKLPNNRFWPRDVLQSALPIDIHIILRVNKLIQRRRRFHFSLKPITGISCDTLKDNVSVTIHNITVSLMKIYSTSMR